MLKKLFAISILMMAAVPAMADIPAPPHTESTGADSVTLTGQDAHDLAEQLKAPWQVENSLRTETTSIKVFRSANGTAQVVCRSSFSRINAMGVQFSCTIEKSKDGATPLPKVTIVHRMG